MKYFFLHIPKAAGSSLISMLETAFGKKYLGLNYNQGLNILKNQKLLNFIKFFKYKILSCHANYGITNKIPGNWRYFTFLRSPEMRISSHFYYVLQEPSHYLHKQVVQQKMSLYDYVSSGISKELDNGQVRVIANYNGASPVNEQHFKIALQNIKKDFEFVGIQENFKLDVQKLFAKLQTNTPKIIKTNVTKIRNDPTQKEINQILEVNKFDFLLWKIFSEKNHQIPF